MTAKVRIDMPQLDSCQVKYLSPSDRPFQWICGVSLATKAVVLLRNKDKLI